MTNTPERVWLDVHSKRNGYVTCGPLAAAPFVEYVRSDVARQMIEDAKRERDYEC